MNKRATILAVGLTLCGWQLQAQDADYTVKVTDIDKAQGILAARFVIVPQDLRIICKGDVRKVFAGDYIKLEAKNGVFVVKGTDAACVQIGWYR